MSESAVAAYVHETLDVHRYVAAKVTFYQAVVFNFSAKFLLFFL